MMPLLHRPTPGSMDVAAAAQSAGGTPALSGDEGAASVLGIVIAALHEQMIRGSVMVRMSACNALLLGDAW